MPWKILAACLAVLPTAAVAEWVWQDWYRGTGRALGFGSGGQTLVASCGAGGHPALTIIGPRPMGGPEETYVLKVDDGAERLVFASCGPDGCTLDFETADQARGLFDALRRGHSLSVGFYRNGTGGDIPLQGSSDALGALLASGCELP